MRSQEFLPGLLFFSLLPKSEAVSLEFFKHDSKLMDKEETDDTIYLDVQIITKVTLREDYYVNFILTAKD